MKMKFGRLAIAAMLLSGSSMVVANDGTSVVGDLPGYGEDAYFGEDAAYTEVQSNNESYADEDLNSYNDEEFVGGVQPVGHTQQSTPRASGRSVMRHASARINRNSGPMQMQPASHQMMGSGYVDSGYGGGGYSDSNYSDCGCGDTSCGGGSSCGGGNSCGTEMSCGCGSSS